MGIGFWYSSVFIFVSVFLFCFVFGAVAGIFWRTLYMYMYVCMHCMVFIHLFFIQSLSWLLVLYECKVAWDLNIIFSMCLRLLVYFAVIGIHVCLSVMLLPQCVYSPVSLVCSTWNVNHNHFRKCCVSLFFFSPSNACFYFVWRRGELYEFLSIKLKWLLQFM